MDLLKSHKSRSRVSSAVHIGLNIGLVVALLLVVSLTQATWLAVTIYLLSKWRVLAVRPRFWYINLVSNMVDIIVGIGAVVLMATAEGSLAMQIAIAILFMAWLVFIKPRSKRVFVAIQSSVAVFVGITALSILTHDWMPIFFVLGMWVIGYVSTRHVLGSYEEPLTTFYSQIAALMFAEIGWIGFHWTFGYDVFMIGDLKISQLALYVVLLCFIAERAYASWYKYGKIRKVDVIMPISLTVAVVISTMILAVVFGVDAL